MRILIFIFLSFVFLFSCSSYNKSENLDIESGKLAHSKFVNINNDFLCISLSILYFKIMAFAYPFISIGMCCSRIMQGLGYAYPMFILTIFRVIIISISLAWYFVTFLNKPIYFAWIGTLISCILTSIVSFIWLLLIIKKTLNMKSVII